MAGIRLAGANLPDFRLAQLPASPWYDTYTVHRHCGAREIREMSVDSHCNMAGNGGRVKSRLGSEEGNGRTPCLVVTLVNDWLLHFVL